MNQKTVENILNKIKEAIKEEIEKNKNEIALDLLSCYYNILYQTNYNNYDKEIESIISSIASQFKKNIISYSAKKDVVFYYDGIGIDSKMIKNSIDPEFKKIYYITFFDYENRISETISFLESIHAEIIYLERNNTSRFEVIMQISDIILSAQPSQVYYYNLPNDVIFPILNNIFNDYYESNYISLSDIDKLHFSEINNSTCEFGELYYQYFRQLKNSNNVILTGNRNLLLSCSNQSLLETNAYKRVSIIIATYNPSIEKYMKTIDSIINQHNVDYEIIIVDDGSKKSSISEALIYMEKEGITNYSVILHDKNQGTVKNYLDGLILSKGKYIKLISPGDYFIDEEVLSHWLNAIDKNNKKWSFGDVRYYKDEGGMCKCFAGKSHPQMVSCYTKNKAKTCIWNYCVLDDIVIGAATLCERETMLKYFFEIVNKVVFAEDNIYRMMMYDGILPLYYSHDVIMYETGTGISTSSESPLNSRMRQDWISTNRIISESRNSIDGFHDKITKRLTERVHKKRGIISRLQDHGWVYYRVKAKIFPRKTNI